MRGNLARMSGQQATDATELQAAARRLAALAERIRVVRTQLGGTAGAASRPVDVPPPGDGGGGDRTQGPAR